MLGTPSPFIADCARRTEPTCHPVVPPYRERILLPPLAVSQDNFLTNFLHPSDNYDFNEQHPTLRAIRTVDRRPAGRYEGT